MSFYKHPSGWKTLRSSSRRLTLFTPFDINISFPSLYLTPTKTHQIGNSKTNPPSPPKKSHDLPMVKQGVGLMRPPSWVMHSSTYPASRQMTWFVWHLQWSTWWLAGSREPAARVAAKNMALSANPTGYNRKRRSDSSTSDGVETEGCDDCRKEWHVKMLGDRPGTKKSHF